MPWKDASDNERLDVDNGLLLSPNYDALFDRHLISFEQNGSIILSDKIETAAYQKIGITGKERLRRDLNVGVVNYLQRHTSQMFGEV